MSAPRTITVAGAQLRLYSPPNGMREFAWANFKDLLRAAEFPLTAISFWAERWRTTYPDRHGVAADGCMIVPAEAAAGLFEAGRQGGWGQAEQALAQLRDGIHELFLEAHRDLDDPAFRIAVNEATLRASVTEGVH